jgi:hypothetical protein
VPEIDEAKLNSATTGWRTRVIVEVSQLNLDGPAAVEVITNVVPIGTTGQGKGGEAGKGETPPAPFPPLPPPAPPPGKNETARSRAVAEDDDVFTPAPLRNPVVAALESAGLYVAETQAGRHTLTCPWAHEHGEGDNGPATYTEPTILRPVGRFRCPNNHADRVQIDRLLEHLGVDTAEARCKPSIRLVAGEMLRVLDAAEKSLVGLGTFYQSGGAIVTVNKTQQGDAAVTLVTDPILTKALAQAADWEKLDGRSKAWRPCDPTPQVVRQLLNAQSYDHLPVLDGVARQPYFRKGDGELVAQPGYDPVSKVYAIFDRDKFGLPEPSKEAAEAALADLKSLVEEFHFATEGDRSAAIGAMVTAAIRSSLPVAPAFNITASTPGSGKSYLGALLVPFAGPGEPLNLSYPTTAEEASKSMLAALIPKPAVISFDDMQTDWLPYGMINRMLTSETVADRVLGVSRTIQVATNVFVMGTGNNVGPVRDMCRRVVSIRLHAPSDSPATLRYVGRPVEAMRADRGRYVAAALTIVQAWREAGRPRTDVPDIATFGAWSDAVRQPLLWLGEADPALSLIEQVRSDPDAELLGRLMAAWHQSFGSRAMTLRKVLEQAERDNGTLQDVIMELPCSERDRVNRSKFGWFLKRNAERIVNGFSLRKEDSSERTAWSVQLVEPQPAAPSDEPYDHTKPVMINGQLY